MLTQTVHPANIQDRHGALLVLRRVVGKCERLTCVIADRAYAGETTARAIAALGPWRIEIVRRADRQAFKVFPKRWIVERTLAWIGRCRRLAKDFENLTCMALAFVHLAMIRLMLRRLARPAPRI
jgi:transposase